VSIVPPSGVTRSRDSDLVAARLIPDSTNGLTQEGQSNIYAKADVSSRHQLSELVRGDPRAFGLTALTG
jgi:hypothetical protein